jgi:hypothetical protein
MEKRSELEIARHAYAKRIMAAVGLNDWGLELAFVSTAREDFLGPGPGRFSGDLVFTHRRPVQIPFVYIPTIS